jgi:hypothetical protein
MKGGIRSAFPLGGDGFGDGAQEVFAVARLRDAAGTSFQHLQVRAHINQGPRMWLRF